MLQIFCHKSVLTVVLGSMLVVTPAAFAQESAMQGDEQLGREKAAICMGCHGVPGFSNTYPSYHVPKLGGQNSTYLVKALRDYRDGKRSHPTMSGNAANLSDRDIDDIASFFSGLTPP